MGCQLDYLTTHTSLSPIRLGFTPGFVNYKKGAFDSQPQVIMFTSCLPMVGGSLCNRNPYFNSNNLDFNSPSWLSRRERSLYKLPESPCLWLWLRFDFDFWCFNNISAISWWPIGNIKIIVRSLILHLYLSHNRGPGGSMS
jgi:hypothetical protein